MRLVLFFKLVLLSAFLSLLAFALVPGATPMTGARAMALGIALSMGAAAVYPEIRGIKAGDTVSVVNDSALPALIGRLGVAEIDARRSGSVRIRLKNGAEITGVVESYEGLISPPKVKIMFEEKLVE